MSRSKAQRKHDRLRTRQELRSQVRVVAPEMFSVALGLSSYVSGSNGIPSVAHIQPRPPVFGRRITYPQARGGFRCCGVRIREIVRLPTLAEVELAEVTIDGVRVTMPAVWTPDEVRCWLTAAMDTLWHMQGDWPAGYRSCMPAPVRSAMEAYGWQDEPQAKRDGPTPAQITQLDICLPWLLRLDITTRKAVVGVAFRLNLRAIGKVVGCSHTQARRLALEGFKAIAEHLNEGALQKRGVVPCLVASG